MSTASVVRYNKKYKQTIRFSDKMAYKTYLIEIITYNKATGWVTFTSYFQIK